ncbi:hypothetical protein ACLESO_28190 [Pyxidicoccus sp. 3LG]
MSERARVRGSGPAEATSTPEDLRRQLEGRLELIESMHRRYRWLDDVLKGGGWQRQLRAQSTLVEEVLARDAACVEALERAARRAELEGWPKDSPVVETVRDTRRCREKLAARVRKRLASLTSVSGAASLEEELRRLESLVRNPVSLAREPQESFSHLVGYTGKQAQNLLGIALPLVAGGVPAVLLAALALHFPLHGLGFLLLGGVVLSVALLVALTRLRPGSIWLTPSRLVWVPPEGEPVALRLDSIPDGGVRLDGSGWGLRVEGDRLVHLPRLGRRLAQRLLLWLEMLRHAELRQRAALVDRAVDLVCFPALLRRDGQWSEGKAVLMRRMLFFLPDPDAGAALLRATTGRTLDSRVDLEWVLDMLRWQPESDVDAYLLRAVKASRGAAWPAGMARLSNEVFLAHEVHITYGADVLTGRVGRKDESTAERLLASWS